jgi:SAM-dependent methyltransferase
VESLIYQLMWENEESHWWFRARRDILTAVVRAHTSPGARVLDAGCGTGFIAEALRNDRKVSLMDSSLEAVRFCRKRGLPAARASLRHLPYHSDTFDLVGCFDVLYHRAAQPLESTLRELQRVLRPGGVLVTVEPAYQWLFGEADVLDHAECRFTAPQLGRHLRQAGFGVRELGYFNTHLAPAIIGMRLLRRLWVRVWPWAEASAEFGKSSGALNRLLEAIFGSEKQRVLRGGYSFGISIIAIGEKRSAGSDSAADPGGTKR